MLGADGSYPPQLSHIIICTIYNAGYFPCVSPEQRCKLFIIGLPGEFHDMSPPLKSHAIGPGHRPAGPGALPPPSWSRSIVFVAHRRNPRETQHSAPALPGINQQPCRLYGGPQTHTSVLYPVDRRSPRTHPIPGHENHPHHLVRNRARHESWMRA